MILKKFEAFMLVRGVSNVDKLIDVATVRNLSKLNVTYVSKIFKKMREIKESLLSSISEKENLIEELEEDKKHLKSRLKDEGKNRIQINKKISPIHQRIISEKENLKKLVDTKNKIVRVDDTFYSFEKFRTEEGRKELLKNLKKAKSSKHNKMTGTIEALGLTGLSHKEKTAFYDVLKRIKKVELIPMYSKQDKLVQDIIASTIEIEEEITKIRDELLRDVNIPKLSTSEREELNIEFEKLLSKGTEKIEDKYFGNLINDINAAVKEEKEEKVEKVEEDFKFDSTPETLIFDKAMAKKFYSVLKVADTNNPRFELDGILIDLENQKMVATDSRRLSITDIEGYAGSSIEPYILAKKDIKKLKDISKIELGRQKGVKIARVTHSKGISTVRNIEGKYPKYQRLIASEESINTIFSFSIKGNNKANKIALIKNNLKIVKATLADILISSNGDEVTISQYNKPTEREEILYNNILKNEEEYDHKIILHALKFSKNKLIKIAKMETTVIKDATDGISILIKKKYLDDALDGGRDGIMYWNGNSLPFIIKANGIKTVIMPIIGEYMEDSMSGATVKQVKVDIEEFYKKVKEMGYSVVRSKCKGCNKYTINSLDFENFNEASEFINSKYILFQSSYLNLEIEPMIEKLSKELSPYKFGKLHKLERLQILNKLFEYQKDCIYWSDKDGDYYFRCNGIEKRYIDEVDVYSFIIENVSKEYTFSEKLKRLKQRNPPGVKIEKQKIKLKNRLITIENIAGSIRSKIGKNGKRWATKMKDHYGYFNNTLGADGDHIDVFINSKATHDKIEERKTFVVLQNNINTKKFDEHKVILGAISKSHAKEIYLRNYGDDFKGFGSVEEIYNLSEWLNNETNKKG